MTTGTVRLAFGTLLCAVGLAYAVDQQILGTSITVRNPSTAAKRKVTIKAKEKASPNTIVGNPITTGANLQVFLTGGSSNNQFFFLPTGTSGITGKPFWSGDAVKGFTYKDPKGENGPVKRVQIKKSASGTFFLKAIASGKLGFVSLVPPNPGTNACVVLDLNASVTYSVKFGPGDGVVTNTGTTLYKHKKVALEGPCAFISSTTSSTASTTTTTSSTSTTLYGSPSRAFAERLLGLLD
jgi:hypothetical protein